MSYAEYLNAMKQVAPNCSTGNTPMVEIEWNKLPYADRQQITAFGKKYLKLQNGN